jgi:NADPH-dependent 2,4-dienoyl-CoA reductase/sulfur reductase-like enzyme
MATALPLTNQPTINVERDVETMIGVVATGASVSFIRNRVEALPANVQSDIEIQRIAAEIENLEKGYLPVFEDFYSTRLTTNPERYVLILMGSLLVIGSCSSIQIGAGTLFGTVVVVLALLFYFRIQYRAHHAAKREMVEVKKLLKDKLYEFAERQMMLMKAKNGGEA